MRFGFLLLSLALGLSACAEPPNTLFDTSACAGPPDRQAVWHMVEPGVVSAGASFTPGRKQVAANTVGCAHQDDKATPPQTFDLHKIG